jgi:hypothetical protein
MRRIRSRIAERTGVDLTNQQIQELAARRLEAILDPRAIKPSLLDELRRAAGLPAERPTEEAEPEPAFEESSLYASPNGLLRAIRRLLNPLLRLFFDPTALSSALRDQAQFNAAAAAREEEQRRRQAEWNALHFEVLRRLVTDVARTEIDAQQLALRVESLSARVDFADRRVRNLEQAPAQARPGGRAPEAPAVPAPSVPREDRQAAEGAPGEVSSEAARRRRRRRRGRRPGGPLRDTGFGPGAPPSPAGGDEGMPESEEGGDSSAEGPAEESPRVAEAGGHAAPDQERADVPRVDAPGPDTPEQA